MALPPPTVEQFVNTDDTDIQELPVKSILEAEISGGKNVIHTHQSGIHINAATLMV